MMNVEQSLEWELAGETEVFGENLLQCHFFHHKSHTTWPDLGSSPGRRSGKPATNRLGYGMTIKLRYGCYSIGCFAVFFTRPFFWFIFHQNCWNLFEWASFKQNSFVAFISVGTLFHCRWIGVDCNRKVFGPICIQFSDAVTNTGCVTSVLIPILWKSILNSKVVNSLKNFPQTHKWIPS
jgi:hypothetical protein